MVAAYAHGQNSVNGEVAGYYPSIEDVDEDLPDRAREYLRQAIESQHSPAGSVMLCASAVDAMLKKKGYTAGSLYKRIDQAIADHLLTQDMGRWAHAVRLDANDERHADVASELPEQEDAQRCIDFTSALGQFLFTLPARVERGIKPTSPPADTGS